LVPKPRQAVAFFGHDGNRHWRDETLAVISIVALFTISGAAFISVPAGRRF
jgi:hypothetical protein